MVNASLYMVFAILDRRAKGREFEPHCSDHRFSHSPSMAYPLAGCFVSANLLKLRHLRGFSVSSDSPCGEGRKGHFGRFSGCFPAVFLRLKRPPTFPLTRLFLPQIPPFSAFFMDSVCMDVKRKVMKIFSAEEQPMFLRCGQRRIQISNTRY